MCKMIINADDFGYCRAVNYGIIDAHLQGVLTSTTLLTNTPGFRHAAGLSKECPSLGVGLHLNIALGQPLTNGSTLTGKDGSFIKPRDLSAFHNYLPEDILAELEAQYQRFVEVMDKKPTHLDSHLFTTDSNPVMAAAARTLAEKYKLPLRNHDISGFPHVDFIQFRTYHGEPGLSYVYDHMDDISSRPYVELMSHPAYVDSYLLQSSSYNLQRLAELDFLVSNKTKDMLHKYSVELINYSQL